MLVSVLAAAVLFVSNALAAPTPVTQVFDPSKAHILIDYNPPVTSPKSGDYFLAGQNITITWDDSVPAYIPSPVGKYLNQKASFLLGYLDDAADPSSEHLST